MMTHSTMPLKRDMEREADFRKGDVHDADVQGRHKDPDIDNQQDGPFPRGFPMGRASRSLADVFPADFRLNHGVLLHCPLTRLSAPTSGSAG